MTEEQKKMKKYCNAIARRLNLPRDIKARVMSDFASSIQERREAGQSDAEIYAEFGTPKEAAADLNEQMMEYAYRKSPWRWLFLGAAVLSGGWLLLYEALQGIGLLLNTLAVNWFSDEKTASIGVIGGADGPTAIFVTSVQSRGIDWDLLIMAAVLVVSILAFLRLRKCKQK